MKQDNAYRQRVLERVVETLLGQFPVVVLTGARQTGKSTLVQHLPSAGERRYRTLDDLAQLERAAADPQAFLDAVPGPQTLDEVQQAPALLRAVKLSVDRDRRSGRFLLTGSANLLLMKQVSESLAGRAAYLTLGPMTEREKAGRLPAAFWDALFQARDARDLLNRLEPAGEVDWRAAALEGGFPPALSSGPPESRARWFDGYVRTYLERDLRQLSEVSSLMDFRRLMQMGALRAGQVLNQSTLARDARLSQATAHRYLNLLEASYQIHRLPSFGVNRTRRLIKAPKLYWGDTGLGAFLAGLEAPEDLTGAFLENLVLGQLLAWGEGVAPRPDVCYWRTVPGEEVDFVISRKRRWMPVEVKAGSSARPDDARGLESFLSEYPGEAPFGVLLYGGREAYPLSERVAAVPVGAVV